MAWNEPGPGHDPWNQGPGSGGGKPGGGGGGLPDLDKLIKRLKASFRRRPGNKKPEPSKMLGLAAIVIAALWLASGFYTVDAQQKAVVLRFGAVSGESGAGLGWHLPWPAGSVRMVNVTKLRQATTQSTLLTNDHNLVDVGLTVQFRVSSARDYLFEVSDPDDTLSQAANSVLRNVVATYSVDDVLGGAQQAIAGKVKEELQQVLDGYHCGLYVAEVSLSQVQPPDPVQDAFADAIKAGDDNKRRKDSARTYAQNRLPQAHTQATQLIADAQKYRDGAVSKARGDTARFDALLNEYRKAPKSTRQRMYIDTMSEILKHSRTVLVDSGKNGPSIDLHIGEGSGSAPPAETSSASNGKVTPPKSSDAGGSAADKGGSPDNSSSRSRDHRGTR